MQGDRDIGIQLQALRDLFAKHMHLKAPTFEKVMRRGGRKLPRRLRAQAAIWVEAEQMSGHPKLARRLDRAALDRAFREIRAHLVTLDMAEQKRTRRLNMLAGLAIKGGITLAALVAVIKLRGLV